ncbi:secretin N-terminal domain-containing protein [Marinobacter sp. VGCF2001]|uniref:secretin N-terminal domain-containing protein n=1 Tax=Marinobacter sp. VGCF2001 TaxID=3417189 RepID=UPI003CF12BE8
MHNPERCTRFWLPTAWLLLLLTLSGGAWAQSEARVYELHNRTADDVAAQVRELYQQTPVTVTARGQQLVVRGEPRLLDEIGTLVQSIDVAPIQMRVSVRYREDVGGKQSGAGIDVSNGAASASAGRRTISTHSTRERQLIVQDGQSAHITSGKIQTLPFAIQGGRNPAAILQQVTTRSGFVVSPQAISNQAVELSIVSFEEDPAALPGYETEALMTIRRVEPGQWVSLGGTRTATRQKQQGISYRVNGKRSENLSIDVKVEILP